MHRAKGSLDKKEQEGNSSGSSYKKRRKKHGKMDKSGYHQDEWGYQPRGYSTSVGGVRIDRLGHFWEPESMPPTTRVLAPPSDPGLCRYAVPTPSPYFPYTYSPIALAVCPEPNFYQAPAAPAPHMNSSVRVPNHSSSRTSDSKCPRSGRRHSRSSKYKPVQNSALSRSATHDCQPNSGNFNEYMSLPPGMQDPCNDDAHRRFSDPGLGNPESDTDSHRREVSKCPPSSDSESSLLEEWPPDTASLIEQVKLLRADNKRLVCELRDTRAELQQLKLHTSTWRNQTSDEYQPGMIADLVREVRDAARMREETLVTGLRLMVADGCTGRLSGSPSVQSVYNEVTGLQNNNKPASFPDREVAERLSRLEDQLEVLRISKGGSEPCSNNVSQDHQRVKHLDGDFKDKASKEVGDELKTRRETGTNTLKFDASPSKNGPTARTSRGQDAVNDTETEESLASLCSSALSSLTTPNTPPPAACVTMTGPVTDL